MREDMYVEAGGEWVTRGGGCEERGEFSKGEIEELGKMVSKCQSIDLGR